MNFMETPITSKLLKLADIVIDAGTQIRVGISESTVADYAARMEDGDKFPNPHVYFDGTAYVLADGFHRYHAMGRVGILESMFVIHRGTAVDARRFALSANGANGLRMTNEDKRKAVAWGLELYPNKSSRELAKICYVSHNFVETCRKQLSSDDSCEPNQLSSDDSSTRIGADGKERKLPVKQPKQIIGEPVQHCTPEEDNEAAAAETHPSPALRGIDVEKLNPQTELTPIETELIDALEVAKADIEYLEDCIMGHSCAVDIIGSAKLNFQVLAKKLEKLANQYRSK